MSSTPDYCRETEASCECLLPRNHTSKFHYCTCGGSWNDDGDINTFPEAENRYTPDELLALSGENPILTTPQPDPLEERIESIVHEARLQPNEIGCGKYVAAIRSLIEEEVNRALGALSNETVYIPKVWAKYPGDSQMVYVVPYDAIEKAISRNHKGE